MKVSVVIPVYNAEKYLGMCLKSILIQTLTDFEVIIVDDCSTDSSLAVVEILLEQFGGRLKLIKLKKNTGNPSIPRNEGLKNARGKYIFFMDNDDLLVDTALETLYNFAEDYKTDVVYMDRGFICDEEIFPETFTEAVWDKTFAPIDKPTLEPKNLSERVEKFLQTNYGWAPWTKFLRRDFLITNKITFPQVTISEDVFWTFKVVCLAKKFLRVPTQLYICRTAKNSWSRVERSPQEEIKFRLNPLIRNLDNLDAFMNSLKFFVQNPNYCFKVTNFFVKMQLAGMLGALDNLDNDELYKIFHREFSNGNGKHAALISNLIIFMNYYRKESVN